MWDFPWGGTPAPRRPVNSSNSKRSADRHVTVRPITPPTSTASSPHDEKAASEIITGPIVTDNNNTAIHAPAPRRPVNPSNSKCSADRNITVRPITPPTSTASSPQEEKAAFEIITGPIVTDNNNAAIRTTAARMTKRLDDTLPTIQMLHSSAGQPPEAFKLHKEEIERAKSAVQMVQHQDGLHTPRVAEALANLHSVIERLAEETRSFQFVSTIMGELKSATTNLYDNLPASIHESNNNRCEASVQITGEIGGKAADGRVIVTSSGNAAKNGGVQITAPVHGENAMEGLAMLLGAFNNMKRT